MGHKTEITRNFRHLQLMGDEVGNKYERKSRKTRPRTVES